MASQLIGKYLILTGLVLVAVGVLLYFGGKAALFGLGRLPGDVRIERGNFHFYFPIVTCILISVILTLVALLISRFR